MVSLGGLVERTLPNSTLATVFPAPTRWTPDQMSDQTGKVALVTGANTGIGYQIAKQLLLHNATVFLGSRDPEKGAQAVDRLRSETGKEATLIELNLSDLTSVKNAANSFIKQSTRIDYLFLNAGLAHPPKDELTKQGYDVQHGIVLGHAYLTQLLLPTIRSTFQEASVKSRVICVSSNGHSMFSGDPFEEDLTIPGTKRTKAGDLELYYHGKMAAVLYANWLDRTHGDVLIANSVHPGGLKSDFFRTMNPVARSVLAATLLSPVEMGAWTPLYMATTPAGDRGGQYFIAWCRERTSGVEKRALEPEWQERLMSWVDRCIKAYEDASSG